MITKSQYNILKFLEPHNELSPISHIEVLNSPFYKNKPNPNTTDIHLTFLSSIGLVQTTNPYKPFTRYHEGHLIITPAGIHAIEEYEEAKSSKNLSLIVSVIALIFAAIAAAPVISSFLKWFI